LFLINIYIFSLFFFFSGYREADGLTALSIAAGKKHKSITEILASELLDIFSIYNLYFLFNSMSGSRSEQTIVIRYYTIINGC